ncbi:hypothetical protein RB195_016738 [Necator americanus]|uniref:Uncharacterized protein n=1 Tax=Necator americanus TaxID=51031 RepID=A0ABR1C1Y0_NECAM
MDRVKLFRMLIKYTTYFFPIFHRNKDKSGKDMRNVSPGDCYEYHGVSTIITRKFKTRDCHRSATTPRSEDKWRASTRSEEEKSRTWNYDAKRMMVL